MKSLIFAALLLLSTVSVQAQETDPLKMEMERLGQLHAKGLEQHSIQWRCDTKTQYSCNKTGCSNTTPTVWVELDLASRIYRRCDEKGCDDHAMTYSRSGIYTVVTVGGGTFLKVLNDGSEFVDIASLGTLVLNSFGVCTPSGG